MIDHIALSVEMAARTHRGQLDKAEAPLILHPLHVMRMSGEIIGEHPDRESVLCAAVLHDVIECHPNEDRPSVRREVYDAAGDRAGEAVDALTRGYMESWNNYIDRLCGDWIARLVKMVDLHHNCDLSRLNRPAEGSDMQRNAKYVAAKGRIEAFEREHPRPAY